MFIGYFNSCYTAKEIMQENEYKTLYELEDYYWWYVGRRQIIRTVLRQTLPKSPIGITIDYGCGTGSNLPLLTEMCGKVTGLDIAQQAVDYCHKRGLPDVYRIDGPSDIRTHAPKGADLITLLDVLEHIEDDEQALRGFLDCLSAHGRLLLTVPAYQFLWSNHDVALHHHRRYTLRGLRRKLEKAGYEIVKGTYAITIMFPVIAFYRLANILVRSTDISDPKSSHVILPPKLNRFIIWLLYAEAWLCRVIRLPFGTSVVVVAKKRRRVEPLP